MRIAVVSVAMCAGLSVVGSAPVAQASSQPATATGVRPPYVPKDSAGGLLAAGNLDRRRGADVLDERYLDGSNSSHGLVTVTARNGATGHAIWHTAVRYAYSGGVQAVPMRLGGGGHPGVLIVKRSESGAGHHLDTEGIRLVALKGRNGHRLWARTFTGITHTSGNEEVDVPQFVGVTRAFRESAADILIRVRTASNRRTHVRPVEVRGSDGHVKRLPTIPDGRLGARLTAVPDMDGDGLDDIAALRFAHGGRLRVESGRTGSRIWTRHLHMAAGLPDFESPEVTPVRVSGGIAPDLVVSVGQTVGEPADELAHGRQVLLRGSDGHRMWTKSADAVAAIHHAGEGAAPAVELLTLIQPTVGLPRSQPLGVVARAVTAAGTPIFRQKVLRHVSPHQIGVVALDLAIGDVEPDGAGEVGVDLLGDHHRSVLSGLIDGRSGKFLRRSSPVVGTGSLSGAPGRDLIGVSSPGQRTRIAGIDGATGHRYFHRSLGSGGVFSVLGIRVEGGSCHAIGVSLGAASHQAVDAMLSANGHYLWTLAHPFTRKFGGTLKTRPAPKHLCAS